MPHLILWFIISAVLYSFSIICKAECEINPFIDKHPLMMNFEMTSFIYPNNEDKTVVIKSGDTYVFVCPGQKVVLNSTETETIVEAKCQVNSLFEIEDMTYTWDQISCTGGPVAVGRYVDTVCGINAKSAEIGFAMEDNGFIRTINLCFDVQKQEALYSHYNITASIGFHQSAVPRPSFHEDQDFYDVGGYSVKHLYLRDIQRSTINGLVGLPLTSTKYIDNNQSYVLSKGHLAAKGDFVYAAEQISTFRYTNVAPQWETFNGNNWASTERDARAYAQSNKIDLQIWTGTFGITSLPHEETGEDVELYLYTDTNTHAIPVPAIYWKLVYNPINTRGIVLIGLNNPYENDVEKYIYCPDVSDQVNWLHWKKDDIQSGYSYACTVDDFRKVVTYVPNLSISGLLV
ncbi:uncharacterized protein LOC130901478 [Diorhabda carinulata]|uniref:uncharacterized protein LOC130901478 n=1 Tax=Diorhabda carinulata TaxID=1163345 RepID=UPI0025A0960F|nr:uncharacterized protein LOC130901478 [Diorhabda carinulata]